MVKRIVCLIITGILIISVFSGCTLNSQNSLGSQSWPCFRGSNHNGISEETISWPQKASRLIWKAKVGVGHSAISVVDNRAYTMGNRNDTDIVVCLNARTGKEIWKYSYACEATYFVAKPFDGPGATPTVDRGMVFTLSRSGHVLALDGVTGALIWKRNLAEEEGARRPQWGFAGSALIDDDRVILNATTGGICLDRKTGATIWKTGKGEGGYASPVPMMLNGKKCIAIFGTQTLTIVDPVNGSVIWKTMRPQPIGLNAADPVVDGTGIFISAGRQCGGARYDISGDSIPVWDNKNMNNHWQTCVLLNGYLYGCEGNHASGAGHSPISMRCLDWKTGELMWENKDINFFGLIAAGNKLLLLTDSGDFIAVEASPTGYKELGRVHVLEKYCFTAPVLVNGLVYLRNTIGDIACLNINR